MRLLLSSLWIRPLLSLSALSLVGCVSVTPQTQGRAVAMPEARSQAPAKPRSKRSAPPISAAGFARRISHSSVPTSEKLLAMTFDDGPHPKLTARLLDLLAQRGVKATFFVVGRNVRTYPALVRRMIAEGHEVASHTDTHPSLTKLSEAGIRQELERTEEAIVAAAQIKPVLLRPPYGATNERVNRQAFSQFGYQTILWSVDPEDWRRPGPSVVASRLVAGAHPGGILLAHDIHAGTIDAMPQALDALLAQGYRFVTVSQLLSSATVLP